MALRMPSEIKFLAVIKQNFDYIPFKVLDERVKHIPYKICPPEPYYNITGREIQPKPVGEEAGILIYQYYPISSVDYVRFNLLTYINDILLNYCCSFQDQA